VVNGQQMMALQWMDRKTVTILSTFHDDVGMTSTGKINRKTNMTVIKHKVVTDYNTSMNSVDKQDQHLSSFPVTPRYAKGYKNYFST
jgi:hypothetical protein